MVLDVTPIRNEFDIKGLEKFLSSTSLPEKTSLGASLDTWPPSSIMKPSLKVQQFRFGQSNPTYHILGSNGREFVLRRKPMANANLVSKTAHAIEREFFMLRGINICNSKVSNPVRKVPVPEVFLLCEDESVIGFVFYLMEFVDGRQLLNPELPGVPDAEQKKHWKSIMETITAIHSIDAELLCSELPANHFPQFQLDKIKANKGKSSYFQRQVKSLTAVQANQAKVVDPIPNFSELCNWISEKAPQDPDKLTLIHGDFKIDNILFHHTEPRVIAVLDWELCTFGHPIFDLGNFLQAFQFPNQLNLLLYKPFKTDMGKEKPGSMESVNAKLQLYADTLGYKWSENDPKNNPVDLWVLGFVFGLLRLSVISQGIAMRVAKGNASSGNASGYARMYPILSQLAEQYIEESKTEGSKF
ncbi:hypothetical protein CLIB1423_11S04302 [[Candida] railenensis]|uniref:Aminoglycoside phosphotransferase domain-containing protein n=1 Tax=[Candida] railenensis TaxID=45579 RepID=A0A9P0VZ42_9ASCO|nr:hypothetical protein CLIB1423_11S04302 [[Candida] railenensis]